MDIHWIIIIIHILKRTASAAAETESYNCVLQESILKVKVMFLYNYLKCILYEFGQFAYFWCLQFCSLVK